MNKEQFSNQCNLVIEKLRDTYIRKNNDYGDSAHSTYEKYGETAYAVRITDKLNRVKSLVTGKQMVADESIIDTMEDTANYFIMMAADMEKIDPIIIYDGLSMQRSWHLSDKAKDIYDTGIIASYLGASLDGIVKSKSPHRNLTALAAASLIIQYLAYHTLEENK